MNPNNTSTSLQSYITREIKRRNKMKHDSLVLNIFLRTLNTTKNTMRLGSSNDKL